ncbi:unnamed protein product [Lactuca saligna]|uniref:Uncharacterized protein n=1 Tax=Lactuca saligna TaxID=75948 RepID=A0AA35VS45_LACSI|nr:unnamed protein product [Lactuca saligna]
MFRFWFINLVQVDVKRSIDEGEKRFNQLSIEERGKFDEETLVNVNNIRKQSATTQRSNDFRNEYIVAVEVLWTPQNENDTLTERELLEDYCQLRHM